MFVPVGTEQLIPRRRFPVVTVALVALNCLVFLWELFLTYTGGQEVLGSFITAFGVVPGAVTSGQDIVIPYFLTPLTSMFVHGSLIHIMFNMVYLLVFGGNVEDRLGRGRYLAFYLLSGLISVGVQVASNPASQIPSVGASGAIAGVLAAYVVLFPSGLVRMFIFMGPLSRVRRVPALGFIGIWFLTQFYSGVASLGVRTAETGGVAYWAHIGGFLGGLALAFAYAQLLEHRSPRQVQR